MRKFLRALIFLLAILLVGCGQQKSDMECSFSETDFSKVAQITLINGENGQKTQISDAGDIAAICKFLRPVTGVNGISGKGYYGYSYSLQMYDAAGTELYHITFANGTFFCGNDFEDGYPTRYEQTNPTSKEVEDFFQKYNTATK